MSKHPLPFLRSAYNYDTSVVSDETALSCPEPTLTQQQFAMDSDPNYIMEQFARTGDAKLLEQTQPSYGDFTSSVTSYHEALNQILFAEATFNSLPASLRTRFDNDPGKFVDFCSKPENHDEALKLGLLNRDAKPLNPFSEEGLGVAPPQRAGKSKPSSTASVRPLEPSVKEGD